jgi:hypothetical protein
MSSREANQVSQDITEATEIFKERKISGTLDPVAVVIGIAALIGEERRGYRKSSATKLASGIDPVTVARNNPRTPFVTSATPAAAPVAPPKRSHSKKVVNTPVAAKAASPAPKSPSRPRKR